MVLLEWGEVLVILMLHFLCLYPNLLEAQDIKIIEKDSQLIHSKCFWAYIKKKNQKTQNITTWKHDTTAISGFKSRTKNTVELSHWCWEKLAWSFFVCKTAYDKKYAGDGRWGEISQRFKIQSTLPYVQLRNTRDEWDFLTTDGRKCSLSALALRSPRTHLLWVLLGINFFEQGNVFIYFHLSACLTMLNALLSTYPSGLFCLASPVSGRRGCCC